MSSRLAWPTRHRPRYLCRSRSSHSSLDTAFASFTVVLRGTGSGVELTKTLAPVIALSVPLYTPIVALLSFAYDEISPWTLPLFLVPAIAAQRLFGLYQDQRRLADDLSEVNERLERANISFATALVATLGRSRPVHRRSLRRGCDLLARHRETNGACPKRSSRRLTSADSCTTSARLGSLPACSRSRAR